jgi:DNA (cytosine-5)-methyltransferase 1
MNYYNEWEPFAGEWLKELIKDGLIPDGTVDNRSIADVEPSDLKGFTQCHFFAGIGGWSRALELARWSPERPVWTGSPPCQPFSAAGNHSGKDDDRHLWPVFFNLIKEVPTSNSLWGASCVSN